MQKIRVMHLMLSLEIGGMENGVVNILRLMRKDTFHPYVCCLERIGSLAEKLEYSNVPIVNMSKKPGFSISLIFKLASLLIKEKIDILHTHCWATLVYGFLAAKIVHVPVLIHGEHGVFNLNHPHRLRLFRMMIMRVHQILTVSDSLKNDLISMTKVSPEKIHAIINGVDTDKFYPQESFQIRRKFGLNRGDKIIGSVGRLDKIKNYPAMIKLVGMFPDPSVKGFIIGDGPARMELESLVNDLGLKNRFFFLGKRTDIAQLIPLFDLFLSCSFSEGLSNTILESMASGIPVVATRVGGNPEIVIDGETGYLVDANNTDDMKDAVEHLFSNRTRAIAMGKKAREVVMKKYRIENMINAYENVYLDHYKKGK